MAGRFRVSSVNAATATPAVAVNDTTVAPVVAPTSVTLSIPVNGQTQGKQPF
ncbi:unnamed protein product [Strongylus vulgaris]|uniref:Uncharacterized protein n=1 Tax=Strongylus vulgaris TaxID=40348 RepID=A0A3P7M174_STRVU|nr:unnamed protein product [Strongylus vulgaris]